MNNAQLAALYTEFFSAAVMDPEMAKRCSLPLLLYVESSWESSKQRVLIIGQETLGWGFQDGEYYKWPHPPFTRYDQFINFENRIGVLMTGYKEFEFAKYQQENYRSPFWRAFRYLRSLDDVSILWTNLFRCSVDGGSVIRNCTSSQLGCILSAQRGLLGKEIRVLQPTAVVFFTGPNYDRALRDEFPDATLDPVQGHTERQFAQVRSNSLPPLSYRIYHPGYLARGRERRAWLGELAQLIAPNAAIQSAQRQVAW